MKTHWRDLVAMSTLEIKAVGFSWKGALVQITLEPLVMTAIVTAALGRLLGGEIEVDGRSFSYLLFALPGVIGMQSAREFAQAVYRSTLETRWGLAALKIAGGVNPFVYVIALKVVPALRSVFKSLVVILAGVIALGVTVDFVSLVLVLILSLLAGSLWSSLAMILTRFVTDYGRRDMVLGLALPILTFAAPTLYPLEAMPGWVRGLSLVNPVRYLVEAFRSAILDSSAGWPFLITVIAVIVLASLEQMTLRVGDLYRAEGG